MCLRPSREGERRSCWSKERLLSESSRKVSRDVYQSSSTRLPSADLLLQLYTLVTSEFNKKQKLLSLMPSPLRQIMCVRLNEADCNTDVSCDPDDAQGVKLKTNCAERKVEERGRMESAAAAACDWNTKWGFYRNHFVV